MQERKMQTIYVAMSGGVDSATVAALLVEAGYAVVGVYMKNWSENLGIANDCPWQKDIADVEAVAKHLGIPWKVYNFEREYKARILDYFFAEYKQGRTPNPDVFCNNLIKFDLFAEKAQTEGAYCMATGHYARRGGAEQLFPWERTLPFGLYTAEDALKDQTYFLQRLSVEQLQGATFPLGEFTKPEVRTLAKYFQLPVAEKRDSQGVCFIGDIDIRDFLRKELHTQPGDIVNKDTGEVVGRHEGLWFYTIGQRQGIAVGGVNPPYFVVDKDSKHNMLFVVQGHENPLLSAERLVLESVSLLNSHVKVGQTVWVSIRYRELPVAALVTKLSPDGKLELITETAVWAPAIGQSAILYEDLVEDVKMQKSDKTAKELLWDFSRTQEQPVIRCTRVLGGGIISQ